jgi:hypothetical protein
MGLWQWREGNKGREMGGKRDNMGGGWMLCTSDSPTAHLRSTSWKGIGRGFAWAVRREVVAMRRRRRGKEVGKCIFLLLLLLQGPEVSV